MDALKRREKTKDKANYKKDMSMLEAVEECSYDTPIWRG